MSKNYNELRFSDDFLFFKILENNQELCKELLELILKIKINRIVFTEKQKTIEIISDGRGIRLDVYVEDDKQTVYNIEMQATTRKNLPKRSRYYQGMIDLNLIERGAAYKDLKKSYVIFIPVDNDFVNRIDKEVSKAQTHEEWRLEYMTLLERDRENREEGQLQQLYALLLKGRLTFEEAYEEVQEILTQEEFKERLEELSSGK